MANENKDNKDNFDEICNRYRRMMQANMGKTHKERLDAINQFRCGG